MYSTVQRWFIEFNCGWRSLKDELREGRPKTAVVSEHWCRVWTVNARSLCDIPSDRGIFGHFFYQHTFNIPWTTYTMAVLQKTFIRSSEVTNPGSMRQNIASTNSALGMFRRIVSTVCWKKKPQLRVFRQFTTIVNCCIFCLKFVKNCLVWISM